MCFGIPSRITEVWDEGGTRMAHVDAVGEVRRVCLAYLPDLAVGDYTVVHAGFALNRLDEETALATLAMMREFAVITDGAGGQPG